VKIDWGAHDGDLVERVIAVMLQQERPRSWRRRASRGDAGVDILEPVGDAFDIYQVKSYTGPLTSKRKTDIKNSLERVKADFGRPVRCWYLVVPMDPSKEAEKWFEGLKKDAGFECEWKGETFVDGLAAKYPHVVDYYLRDGKARLENLLGEWADIVQVLRDPRPLLAADLVPTLEKVSLAINRDDPHFRYEFSITGSAPALGTTPSSGLVLDHVRQLSDTQYLKISVFERYIGATQDRPVTGTFTVSVEKDSPVAQQLQSFMDYGSPVELPHGSIAKVAVDAPGGLGLNAKGGAVVISQPAGAEYTLRLVIEDPDGKSLAEAKMRMQPAGAGQVGRSIAGEEENHAFTISGVIDPTRQTAQIRYDVADLAGRLAVEVAAAVHVLAVLCAPNVLAFAGPYGPPVGGMPITETKPMVASWLPKFVDDLVTIQQASTQPVTLPHEVSRDLYGAAREAARLLRGETSTGTWNDFKYPVDPERLAAFVNEMSKEQALEADLPLRIEVDNRVHDLGRYRLTLPSARLSNLDALQSRAEAGSSTDEIVAIFEPGSDQTYSAHLNDPSMP
jgi:hypothetical protein